MSEKEKTGQFETRPLDESKPSEQPAIINSSERDQIKTTKRVIIIGSVASLFVIVAYLYLYLQTKAWQILVVSGLAVVSLACTLLANRLLNRRNSNAAGRILLLGILLSYGGGELVLANLTPYLLGGGIPLILIVGWAVLPRRWKTWSIAAAALILWIWLVNWLKPLPRYEGLLTANTQVYTTVGLSALVGLFILWHIIRLLRVGTLRSRLIIAFIALVLFPTIIISAVSVVTSLQNGREQVIRQLESVATLKEAEIQSWLQNLQTGLNSFLLEAETPDSIDRLLNQEEWSQAYYRNAYLKLRNRFQQSINVTQRFEELFLLDQRGQVILSTDVDQEEKIFGDRAFFQEGLKAPYVHPPIYEPSLERISIIVALPVKDETETPIGVLAGRVSREPLNEIMRERAGLGDTGETYLVGKNNALLTESRFSEQDITYVHSRGANRALENQASGYGLYDGYRGEGVVGVYRWLPELQVALLAEQDQAEAFSAINFSLFLNGAVAVLAVGLAVVASLWVTRSITTPMANLAQTATQIADGNLELEAEVKRQDEIGAVAEAFNSMTSQLRGLIEGLEARVAERTHALEQRSAYLEAASEVGRAAASILDTDRLIRRVVELIRERFDLYYVALFRVDESGEWAVLQAGTGEAGQAMLAREHRMQVGEGMIGWSIANAEARIASQAEADAVRLVNPELPLTRSEAALPLRSRGRVLGALSVQSEQPDAFDPETLTVLQTMADQVAVALDNASLFAETETAVEAQRRAYGQVSREAWSQLLRARPDLGFRRGKQGLSRIVTHDGQETGTIATPSPGGPGATQSLPVQVREKTIGVVNAQKPPEAGDWTKEELEVLNTLIGQLELALESARLHQEAQRRAVREQIAREITEKVRAAPDVESIARMATEELIKALGGARGFVKLAINKRDDGESKK